MENGRLAEAVLDGERVIWRGKASPSGIIGWKWRQLAIGLLLVAVATDFVPLLGAGTAPEGIDGMTAEDAGIVAAAIGVLDLVSATIVGIVGLWVCASVAEIYIGEVGREYAITDRRIISARRSEISSTPLFSVVGARSSRTRLGGGVAVMLSGSGGIMTLAGIGDPELALKALSGGSEAPGDGSPPISPTFP